VAGIDLPQWQAGHMVATKGCAVGASGHKMALARALQGEEHETLLGLAASHGEP